MHRHRVINTSGAPDFFEQRLNRTGEDALASVMNCANDDICFKSMVDEQRKDNGRQRHATVSEIARD